MSSRVLITGANRGIGLALARHYHAQGWLVVGVCRTGSPELGEIAEQVIEGVDVTRAEDVARLAEAVRGQQLELLINNAGLLHDESLGSLDFAAIQRQMEVNAYGPLRVTEALLDNLGPGSMVANVTSRRGSIADNDSG
ncbi:MAG: SDR family NAD(P)-dependent oxidoreductase, partial [Halomonas sp.]|nr:SDR family NAD(P)-dependent oxidoreductase [Halomonas sp.]MDX5503793.1 SDR family NAD(P)-dependent oxidoreductase [Halomonas sp.]